MAQSPGNEPTRLAIVGGVGVGKTSLLGRLTSGKWSVELEKTSGVNFQLVTLASERLHVWDVAGDPRFAQISASSYFRSIQGALLCYDTNRPDSLAEVSAWADLLKQWAPEGFQAVLCGMKHDGLNEDPHSQRAAALALALGVPRVVCSAMTGAGVDEVFSMLVGQVRRKQSVNCTRQSAVIMEASVGPLTEIKLTSEKSNDLVRREKLETVADSCQSIAARLGTCPVVTNTLGPCGIACPRLIGKATEVAAPRRQPSSAAGKPQTTLPSEAWMCERSDGWMCERSDGGGALPNFAQAPACKQQLRA